MSHQDDLQPIRESVRALCEKFPGEYWRELDRERAYPTEFVKALTEAGYLAALIPEEYGGSGLTIRAAAAILEEVHASGCNGAACHAQMYTMGTILRHGSDAQKKHYLPRIAEGELRLQAFGVTEPTSGTDTLSLRTTREARRRPLRHQRPEDLDLARRTFRPDAAAGAHDAEGAGREAHRGAVGVPRRHARRQGPHHQADPHHDEPRDDGGVLRRSARAGGEPDRRRGQGLPLHPVRHERRAHPDRGGMHRRRQMVHRQGDGLRQGARICSAGRSARIRACSFRSRAPTRRCAPPN